MRVDNTFFKLRGARSHVQSIVFRGIDDIIQWIAESTGIWIKRFARSWLPVGCAPRVGGGLAVEVSLEDSV
jgi:hypothetical protein